MYARRASVSTALIAAGDEVIYNRPPWFFYEGMILNSGGVPVSVPVDTKTFELDPAAIEQAITERTRFIIVNSPNNPTGKGVLAGHVEGAGSHLGSGERPPWADHLSAVGRGLSEDRLRWRAVREPDEFLSQLDHDLFLWKDASHTGAANRLRRLVAGNGRARRAQDARLVESDPVRVGP